MENGGCTLVSEPEPLALSRAELTPTELEPLSLSLSEDLLLNLLMSVIDSMFEETAKVRVPCCHLIIQRWGGFLLLSSPGSGIHVQTH